MQNQRVPLPTKDGFLMPYASEIVYCQAVNNYSIAIMGEEQVLVTKTLKFLEEKLVSLGFVRIHHSYLVNIQHISSFNKATNRVLLVDGTALPVSRAKKAAFLKAIWGK